MEDFVSLALLEVMAQSQTATRKLGWKSPEWSTPEFNDVVEVAYIESGRIQIRPARLVEEEKYKEPVFAVRVSAKKVEKLAVFRWRPLQLGCHSPELLAAEGIAPYADQ